MKYYHRGSAFARGGEKCEWTSYKRIIRLVHDQISLFDSLRIEGYW